jgi:NAD(P)-dependent dehydrogenase (short-subunit alcohol dehydrogenase family)
MLEEVVKDLVEQYGVKALPIQTDILIESDIITLVQKTIDEFETVDVLVNNAGIYINKPLLEQTIEDWHKVIDTNLTAAFLLSREVAKIMIPKKSGCIINIASTFGYTATRFPEVGYYSSKAGIIMMTKALAIELGEYNIRVNANQVSFQQLNQSMQ